MIGVLAFHGDFAEHIGVLRSMKTKAMEVRSLEDLQKVDRLIIPGGESTVMSKFLVQTGLAQEIKKRSNFSRSSGSKTAAMPDRNAAIFESPLRKNLQPTANSQQPIAMYGTCAGAILLAKKVTGKNRPASLGLMDITVERNAYGTQTDSFEAIVKVKGLKTPVRVAFIRAPIITAVGEGVEVLASHGGHPVLVRQGRLLAGTFHPEVRGNDAIHRMFLRM